MKTFYLFNILLFIGCLPPTDTYQLKNKIPNDQNVTIGTLDNGLTYYVRNNNKPENRIEMLLVLNAGSVLETDEQQGLAHFVEHMAFNGTKSFPKQEIVEYLETIGMDFGPDLNAYTSFDETVYMLQVPSDNSEQLEKGFQILSEWAYYMSFENEEIDKERGVIVEEWRLRGGANKRMTDEQLPTILKDSKYAERLPIGKKAIIDTFHYQTAIDFYKSWYRPELMAVIAVGDADDNLMEDLIKKYFGSIPKSTKKIERPNISVPDHDETLYTIASDPEASYSNISIIHKFNPKVDKSSILSFKNGIIFNLYNNMLNSRLDELTKSSNPPFIYAYSRKGSWVQTKDMFTLSAYVKTNGIENGMEALLKETLRLQKFGFTESELKREKTKYLRNLEKKYNEKDKTESEKYKWLYKNNFLENDPIPSIEFTYEAAHKLVPEITIKDVNELSNILINNNNRVISANSPENEQTIIPKENDLKKIEEEVINSEISPYIDAISNEPLISSLRAPGEIIESKTISTIGVTEWILSNGAKVVLKPTDYKNDEILFYAFSLGGNSLVSDENYIAAQTSAEIITESGLGNFTKIELEKLLSDKVANVNVWIDDLSEGLKGNSTPKDQETMFKLIYQYFNAPKVDSTAYLAFKSRTEGWLENRNARPENVFRDTIQVTKSKNHFRQRPWSIDILKEMNMNKSLEIFKDRFSDAGDFTFFFVGNFDIKNIKKLVEKYIASLPSKNLKETFNNSRIEYPNGIVENVVKKGIDPKSMVRIIFNGNLEWSETNRHILKSLEGVIDIKLREVMREDMGGTYGVWSWSDPKHYPKEEYEFNIMFGCAPENVDTLVQAMFTQIDSLKSFGIPQEYISKVQEKQRQARKISIKENTFWIKSISSHYFHNENPENILKYDELVNSITTDVIQKAAKKYLDTNNYIKVTLYPEIIE